MTEDPTRVIEFSDVSCVEAGRTLLTGVNITVRAGEVVALSGPAGTGKTLVLELVLGSRAPAKGTVRVLGEPAAAGPTPARARMGSVGAAPGFPPFLRVDDVLDIHRSLSSRWDAERAAELLDRLGVANDALAGSLSLRERRRLALVCAVASMPVLLLIDEVEGDVAETALLVEAALDSAASERPAILYATRADAPAAGRAVKLSAGPA